MAQNIVQGLFGPSPWEAQQGLQQGIDSAAMQYAQMSPLQRAASGMHRAGGQIGGLGAEAFGMVNPEVQMAKNRQAVTQEGGLDFSPAGLRTKAKRFLDIGDQRTAFMLIQYAQQQEAAAQEMAMNRAKEMAQLKKAETEASPIAKLSPKDYTPESWAEYEKTGKTSMLRAVTDQGKAPSSVQEYRFAVSQGYKGSYEQWVKDKARAGAASTSVTIAGEREYTKERQKASAAALQDLEKAAESAYKANQALDRFVTASATGAAGGAQPLITGTQNFLASFGFDSENLKSTAQMEQAIGQILGSKMAELGARGLTDKDMEVLRQSLPRVNTSRGAREEVARVLKTANQSVIREYESELTSEAETFPELKTRQRGWYRQYKTGQTNQPSTPEEVKALYKAGTITKEQAKAILKDMGM